MGCPAENFKEYSTETVEEEVISDATEEEETTEEEVVAGDGVEETVAEV